MAKPTNMRSRAQWLELRNGNQLQNWVPTWIGLSITVIFETAVFLWHDREDICVFT